MNKYPGFSEANKGRQKASVTATPDKSAQHTLQAPAASSCGVTSGQMAQVQGTVVGSRPLHMSCGTPAHKQGQLLCFNGSANKN